MDPFTLLLPFLSLLSFSRRDAFASTAGLLIVAALAKIFLTLLAIGVRVPAGVYMPTMAIGACAGRAMGMLVQAWQK